MTGPGAHAQDALQALLGEHGLLVLAVADLDAVRDAAWLPGARDGFRAVLVGNAGSAMWRAFRASPEFRDGRPNPLDRWSRRVGSDIAARTASTAVFPFDGPPYPPFTALAVRGGGVFTSPLSMAIHGRYGLWHAYRFMLLTETAPARPAPGASPCADCPDTPCLRTCPVDAFAPGRYQVRDCVSYLENDPDSACRQHGCAARRACPVGTEWRYEPEHARFHMAAFLAAMAGAPHDLD